MPRRKKVRRRRAKARAALKRFDAAPQAETLPAAAAVAVRDESEAPALVAGPPGEIANQPAGDSAGRLDHRLMTAIDAACLMVAAALGLEVLAGLNGASRLLLTVVFTSAVPGWALVRGLGFADTATGAAMAVPTSLAICAGASAVMVWMNLWHPLALLIALTVIAGAVLGWALFVPVRALIGSPAALVRR